MNLICARKHKLVYPSDLNLVILVGSERVTSRSRKFGLLTAAALTILGLLQSYSFAAELPQNHDSTPGPDDEIILPEPIGDPIEPVNRALWSLNQGLLKGAIQPSSKVYRAVVPSDVRRGFRNAGRNLQYPRNLAVNLLQRRWAGARNETYRFLLNSVGGLGGLFDVASDAGIPSAERDFGQAFRDWGWNPKVFLLLPITGPSNERDAVGGFADRMVNPISYFSPYSYIPLGITYNNLTDTVDEYIRTAKSSYDPYYLVRYAWIIAREARPVDITVEGSQDARSLETLQSVFFRVRDARFPERGDKRTVEISATGKKLPFTLWMQPGNAPLVFIVPGFGSHRLSGTTLALAEILFEEGFSVVAVSNTFNYEFMERGATTALPGYTPVDTRDLHVAVSKIDEQIQGKFAGRVTARALLGYSMGGFQTLYLAGSDGATDPGLLDFDRYVAINTPVRLDHAITTLDEHFRAALDWPADERTAKIGDIFAKVAVLATQFGMLKPGSPVPLDATESKFILGLAFRLSLRDVIFLSQSRTNMAVLDEPVSNWHREDTYREILQYTFQDYLEQFVTPYYRALGIDLDDPAELTKAVSLRQFEKQFTDNPEVRVIINENDPLLGGEDTQWLLETFGNERLRRFPNGGHLGNLNQTVVQREIVRALADLLPPANY